MSRDLLRKPNPNKESRPIHGKDVEWFRVNNSLATVSDSMSLVKRLSWLRFGRADRRRSPAPSRSHGQAYYPCDHFFSTENISLDHTTTPQVVKKRNTVLKGSGSTVSIQKCEGPTVFMDPRRFMFMSTRTQHDQSTSPGMFESLAFWFASCSPHWTSKLPPFKAPLGAKGPWDLGMRS